MRAVGYLEGFILHGGQHQRCSVVLNGQGTERGDDWTGFEEIRMVAHLRGERERVEQKGKRGEGGEGLCRREAVLLAPSSPSSVASGC